MKKYLLSLIAAGALLTGCSKDEELVFGGVYGTIRDAVTGVPIYNAEITLSPGNRTTVSGSDGSYEYQNIDAGQYSLSVAATGYQYNSRTVSVQPGETTLCDMRLTPENQMSGVEISTTTLNFDKVYSELTFEIRNTGTSGSVNWTITGIDVAWLSVNPMSGTTDMGKSSSVKVTVNRSLITEDVSTIFTINAAGGSKSIMVSVRAGSGGNTGGDNSGDDGNGTQNVTNGLYAYYTFENNVKNLAEEGGNGQLMNNPIYVDGVKGSTALKFSASDNGYMLVPAQNMISGTEFSISFWVKNISNGHIFHTTRTLGLNDSYGDNATGLYMSGGRLRFIVTAYSTYYEYDHDKYYFTHGSFDSDWHMITVVTTVDKPRYAYAETKLYIDGEFIDSVSEYAGNTSKSYKDTKQFIIGGKLDYNALQVNAVSMSIDNLRIYNTRALSDSEIKQIYNYEK